MSAVSVAGTKGRRYFVCFYFPLFVTRGFVVVVFLDIVFFKA